MAKGNPNSAAVQYKVHLKPTEVGALVMKRMERPHLDKSAELRRLIELGYAAEQAGFILDGTILRHAGREWNVQPIFNAEPKSASDAASSTPGARERRGGLADSHQQAAGRGAGASTGNGTNKSARESPPEANASPPGDGLRTSLRNLSG